MIRLRPLHTIVLLLLVALISCYSSTAAVQNAIPVDLAFGFNLFKAVAAKNDNKNVVISPSSGYMVLALAAQGAAGNTEQ